MKKLEIVYDYTTLLVSLAALAQFVCFFSNAQQVFPYLIQTFDISMLLIGVGLPPAIFLIFMHLQDESQKKMFWKLCLKWMGLLFFVGLLQVLARASIVP